MITSHILMDIRKLHFKILMLRKMFVKVCSRLLLYDIMLMLVGATLEFSYFKNFSQKDLLCFILRTEVDRVRGRAGTVGSDPVIELLLRYQVTILVTMK